MPLGSVPDGVGWVAGIAAAMVAVATAIKKAVVPVMRGLRDLIRHGSEVVEGAQVAREQLKPNGGHSLADQVSRIEDIATSARSEAEAARSGADAAKTAIDEHERRYHDDG